MHDIVDSLKICSWMQDQSILLSADVTGGHYKHSPNEPCPAPWTISNCASFENTVQSTLSQRYVEDGIFLPVILLFNSGILTKTWITPTNCVKNARSECGGYTVTHPLLHFWRSISETLLSGFPLLPREWHLQFIKTHWGCGSHCLIPRSLFAQDFSYNAMKWPLFLQ